LFNHADSSFDFFFTGDELVTSDSTRAGVRLGLHSHGTAGACLRLGLVSSGLGSGQGHWNVISRESDSAALSLILLEITRSAWRLNVDERGCWPQALSLFIAGEQESSGQSVLRLRAVERFTN